MHPGGGASVVCAGRHGGRAAEKRTILPKTPGEAPTSELLSGTQPATDGRLHAATLPRLLFPIRLERRGSLAR